MTSSEPASVKYKHYVTVSALRASDDGAPIVSLCGEENVAVGHSIHPICPSCEKIHTETY